MSIEVPLAESTGGSESAGRRRGSEEPSVGAEEAEQDEKEERRSGAKSINEREDGRADRE